MSRQYKNLHTAQRRTSKGKRFIPRLLLIIFVFSIYSFFALSRELPAGRVELFNNNESAESVIKDMRWPDEGQAAIGTLEDGLLASSHDNEESRPIASLAKVITALAVLEKAPLALGETGIIITFDEEDEDVYWEYANKLGTVTAVTAGAEMNQYQALQAMFLPSSNNVSDALARRVFGSVDSYADYANDMVRRYGLTKTHIADASGFSSGTTSTPSEMIIIGQKVLQHPVLAEIVDQQEAEIPLAGVVPNYNGLLRRYDEVNGIKPGNTDEAGWCLLFSAEYTDDGNGEETSIIGVLLGEDNPYDLIDASAELLEEAKTNLRQIEVVRGGDVVGTYVTAWGDSVELVAQESLWSRSLSAESPELELKQQKVSVNFQANSSLGQLSLKNNSERSIEVIAARSISRPSILWRLTHPTGPNF